MKKQLWSAALIFTLLFSLWGCSVNIDWGFEGDGNDGELKIDVDVDVDGDNDDDDDDDDDDDTQAEHDITFTGVKAMTTDEVMTQEAKDRYYNAYVEAMGDWVENEESSYVYDKLEWHEVGTINVNPYKEEKLLVLNIECEGPCFSATIMRFSWNEESKHLTLLKKHSADEIMSYEEFIADSNDSRIELDGLDAPEVISFPDGENALNLSIQDRYFDDDDLTLEVAFSDEVAGDVYTYEGEGSGVGCLFLKLADGTVSTYEYETGFFDNQSGGVTKTQIVWNDGSANTDLEENYALTHQGCGVMGSCYFVESEDLSLKTLHLAGTTTGGISLYEASLPGVASARSNELLNDAYETYKSFNEFTDEETMTFEEFVDIKPLLFWQDPLERWATLTNTMIQPPAECGKPVIYLYPEETIDVHVEVSIDEFTETIPEYGENGWTVSAQPDGTLYNYEDGETYPYLFWEGYKKDTMGIDEGFMVARDDVEEFLDGSLSKMGLNETEKADFMEFWVPRMLDNTEDYFFVSFVGTKDFNKVAPLTIEPAPDTLIRVFMYYMPTNSYFTPIPQKLSSIDRNGFTVIEWGGTSSKPWKK